MLLNVEDSAATPAVDMAVAGTISQCLPSALHQEPSTRSGSEGAMKHQRMLRNRLGANKLPVGRNDTFVHSDFPCEASACKLPVAKSVLVTLLRCVDLTSLR
jgi:hypothetical protein